MTFVSYVYDSYVFLKELQEYFHKQNQGVPTVKENMCCQNLKKMLKSQKLIKHDGSHPRFRPQVNCRIYSFYVARLRIKTKFRGTLVFFT